MAEGHEKVKSKSYSSLISVSNFPIIVNFPYLLHKLVSISFIVNVGGNIFLYSGELKSYNFPTVEESTSLVSFIISSVFFGFF